MTAYWNENNPRWRSIKGLLRQLRKLIQALIDLLRLVDGLAI